MRLTNIYAEGFRCFGPHKPLSLDLAAGITTLVGENDSGKTAVVDAVRLALGSRGEDYLRLRDSDFHVSVDGRVSELRVRCSFEELTEDEETRYLEWTTLGVDGKLRLFVTLLGRRGDRIWYERRSGFAGDGPTVDGELREHIRATYLRPLRDAERELRPGQRSRLSQILSSLPELVGQGEITRPVDKEPETLAEILKWADDRVGKNDAIQKVERRVNEEYLAELSLAGSELEASLELGRDATLMQLLERLELAIGDSFGLPEKVARGLGMNNVLFMAAELLLLQSQLSTLHLLLVEEPEAHLHPQLQVRFMNMLRKRLEKSTGAQVLLTSHSPVLSAGAPVESLVLVSHADTYPLKKSATKLDSSDYEFLARFLDATKANLFFAKGVLIVEGDAENLLLPALARRLGRPLDVHGVSIVKVGHTGLFRYSRIFQRADDAILPVPVACITDRDIPPDEASTLDPAPKKTKKDFDAKKTSAREKSRRKPEGGCVRAFISPQWTLEYDLAASDLVVELHQAIQLASTHGERGDLMEAAKTEVEAWKQAGMSDTEIALRVFGPLHDESVSKAAAAEQLACIIDRATEEPDTFRTRLPAYLVEAIEYVTSPIGLEAEAEEPPL